MKIDFLQNSELRRVLNSTAAGTTTVTSSVVDIQGYNSCTFLVALGAVTAGQVTAVKVQVGDQSNLSDAVDVAALIYNVQDADSNKLIGLELIKPKHRYAQVTVVRGTQNVAIDGAFAALRGPRVAPVVQGATVAAAKQANV